MQTLNMYSILKMTLGVVMAAVLGLTVTMFSAHQAEAAVLVDSDTVRVESGDTLSGIAETFLGDASLFTVLADINDIADPNLIFPGQLIDLPSAVEDGAADDRVIIIRDEQRPVVEDQTNFEDLFALIVLTELMSDDDEDVVVDGQQGAACPCPGGSNDLVDLIILSELFGNNGNLFGGTSTGTTDFDSLFQLIILTEVLDDKSGSGSGLF